MSSFQVTPADLQGLAGQLSGLLGDLEQAAGSVRMDAAGAAQNGQLEGAIAAFLADWSHGLGELQTRLSELGQRLDGGAGSYEGTEGRLAGGFGSG